MGQANIWYAQKKENEPLVENILRLIGGRRKNAPNPNKKGRKGSQDQERKAKIEKAAILKCKKYYEKLDYDVRSVEKDNVGWDLEAILKKTTLQIEVKGLSSNTFSVELTPNEYKAFSKKSKWYRLAVVLNALTNPELLLCRFSNESGAWIVDGNNSMTITVEPKESASIIGNK